MLYHRVNRLQPDPWTLCVSPEHFAEQLQVVRSLSPRPCLTFDDGYADNLHNALPLLEKYDVPACFFITSGAIGLRTEMWWDALDRLYPDPDSYAPQYLKFRTLSAQEQDHELERIFEESKLSRTPRAGRRMLTADELVSMAASPLVEIGAHTVTHPVLSQLSGAQQEEEIGQSKRQLEAWIGYRVLGFSYPNGTDADYTFKTVEAVRSNGFHYAYSAFEHSRTDPFQLPRVMIRDWNGDEFARVLEASCHRF